MEFKDKDELDQFYEKHCDKIQESCDHVWGDWEYFEETFYEYYRNCKKCDKQEEKKSSENLFNQCHSCGICLDR